MSAVDPTLPHPAVSGGARLSESEILGRLREMLETMFEIEPARVRLDADLYGDLELDSIDAVDLAIKLQEMTGKRIRPDEFRSVRTVRDVVAAVDRLLAG